MALWALAALLFGTLLAFSVHAVAPNNASRIASTLRWTPLSLLGESDYHVQGEVDPDTLDEAVAQAADRLSNAIRTSHKKGLLIFANNLLILSLLSMVLPLIGQAGIIRNKGHARIPVFAKLCFFVLPILGMFIQLARASTVITLSALSDGGVPSRILLYGPLEVCAVLFFIALPYSYFKGQVVKQSSQVFQEPSTRYFTFVCQNVWVLVAAMTLLFSAAVIESHGYIA